VAVKVIPPSPDVPKRLLFREREIAKKLGDVPGDRLIRVRDTAEVDGTLFIVMERAKESLAQFLKRHRALAEDKTILVLRDVAAGLRQLQEASVIHRDLKPENILFDEGHWKLGDFGIARDADLGTQSLTFLGWGSYPYMAPETWRGLSPSIKTDLYALGCVAFELLTGSPPFPGPEPDFARQHKVEPPPASALEGSRLKPLVLRLLSKDPASRPQDAKAVENSLAAAAAQVGQPYGRIASLAGEHAGERAHEDAMLSARQAQEAARKGLVTQAAADLETLDAIQAA